MKKWELEKEGMQLLYYFAQIWRKIGIIEMIFVKIENYPYYTVDS